MISAFGLDVDEICAHLPYCAVYSGNYFKRFRRKPRLFQLQDSRNILYFFASNDGTDSVSWNVDKELSHLEFLDL
jgi:hypothetical protein